MSSVKMIVLFWGSAVLSLVIILGNLAVCVFLPGSRNMRTLTKVLILNLAVADLCFGMAKMAELVIFKIVTDAQVINIFCKTSVFITFICCAVSIMSLSAIAGERYLAVVKPLRYFHRRNQRPKHLSCGIVVAWLVTGMIMVPAVYVHQDNNYMEVSINEIIFCAIRLKLNIFSYVYIAVITITYVFSPLVVVVFSYSLVIRKLWAIGLERNKSSAPSHLMASRRKLTKILLAITVIFVACWLAIIVQDILYLAGYDSKAAETATQILVMFKSATDPALYVFHGVNLRRNLRKVFGKPRRKARLGGSQNIAA